MPTVRGGLSCEPMMSRPVEAMWLMVEELHLREFDSSLSLRTLDLTLLNVFLLLVSPCAFLLGLDPAERRLARGPPGESSLFRFDDTLLVEAHYQLLLCDVFVFFHETTWTEK